MTNRKRVRFIYALIGVCFSLTVLTTQAAPEQIAKQADVEKLQDQVHALDKDVGVFNAKLEAQDKRLQDIQNITTSQANHIAMVANQTTALGNWIAWSSAIITLLVFVAGYFSFDQKKKAIEEARRASKEEAETSAKNWFDAHTKELKEEISKLKHQAQQDIENTVNELSAAKDEALKKYSFQSDEQTTASFTGTDRRPLAEIVESLKSKPETDFTAEDFFNQGALAYDNAKFEIALEAFSKALDHSESKDFSPTTHALCLFRKGVCLGKLNRSEEEIDVYNLIDQCFGSDPAPALRIQVAKALINKGITLGQLNRSEEEIDVYNLIDQRFGSDPAPALRIQVTKALINRGITLGQLNRSEEAINVYNLIEQRYGSDPDPTLRKQVAKALFNKGYRLGLLNRSEEAINVYDLIEQRYGSEPDPTLREQVTKARRARDRLQ